MTPNPGPHYPIPDATTRLLDYLCIEDRRTGGKPALRLEDEAYAREWLVEVALDTLLLFGHTYFLCRFYGAHFRQPIMRYDWPEWGVRPEGSPNPLFPHNDLMEAETEAVVKRGVSADVLPTDRLAVLLLNPYALWDLADLIHCRMPEAWDEAMDRHAAKMIAESGFVLPMPKPRVATAATGATPQVAAPQKLSEPPNGSVPAEPWADSGKALALALSRGAGKLNAQGNDCWRLTFDDKAAQDLRRQIALHLYGDEREFELRLHRLDAGGGMRELELEVSPAPTREGLTFRLRFATGTERTLTLERPVSLRARTRSEPGERMKAEECELEGCEAEWGDEMPPVLMLRKR